MKYVSFSKEKFCPTFPVSRFFLVWVSFLQVPLFYLISYQLIKAGKEKMSFMLTTGGLMNRLSWNSLPSWYAQRINRFFSAVSSAYVVCLCFWDGKNSCHSIPQPNAFIDFLGIACLLAWRWETQRKIYDNEKIKPCFGAMWEIGSKQFANNDIILGIKRREFTDLPVFGKLRHTGTHLMDSLRKGWIKCSMCV